jgi:hypothetical protein
LTHLLVQYSYLQILDFVSTIAFLAYGVQEANPLIRWLMAESSSPVTGLLVVKLAAVGLGIVAWRMNRRRLLARVNIFFAAVVVWNLVALVLGSAGTA